MGIYIGRRIGIACCIVSVHFLAIIHFLSAGDRQKYLADERLLVLLLPAARTISTLAPQVVIEVPTPAIRVPLPDFTVVNNAVVNTDAAPVNSAPVLKPPVQSSWPTIFDPRLRSRLGEAQQEVYETDKNNSWILSNGARVVEMGNGECIKSMPQLANERGTRWSLRFKCGKNASDTMADDINRAMRLRE
ncbi:MAG TPA: hypothetical protein PK129_02250 [Cellvibrionaceae bacterium]|nr:hypothetical protein [Cellvibrionaceae bacterium]